MRIIPIDLQPARRKTAPPCNHQHTEGARCELARGHRGWHQETDAAYIFRWSESGKSHAWYANTRTIAPVPKVVEVLHPSRELREHLARVSF